MISLSSVKKIKNIKEILLDKFPGMGKSVFSKAIEKVGINKEAATNKEIINLIDTILDITSSLFEEKKIKKLKSDLEKIIMESRVHAFFDI